VVLKYSKPQKITAFRVGWRGIKGIGGLQWLFAKRKHKKNYSTKNALLCNYQYVFCTIMEAFLC